ncbi:MAG: cache domain-containing protein [Anaeromyxobacteraceae bacterium]
MTEIYRVSSAAAPEEGSAGSGGRRRGGLGLVAKTAAAMLVVGLLPLLLYGVVTVKQMRDMIRADAEASMKATAEQIASVVDEWVDKNVRVLQAAAKLPGVTGMNREQQSEVLATVHQVYPWMYLVFTVAPDGQNVARSDDKPLTSYADRQYFKDVAAYGKALSWETLIGKTSKKPALVVAVPIKSGDRVVGVLASAMAIEDISRMVANWKSGKTGYAFLVDQNGKVVAHPKEEFVLTEASLADHPLVSSLRKRGLPSLMSFTSKAGPEAVGYVQPTALLWAVGVQQDEAELFGPLRQSVGFGVLLLAGAMVLVALVAAILSRRMVRPIVALTEAADRMSMGELDQPIDCRHVDELGDLARSLERVRKSMKSAMDRLTGGAARSR